jgi:hypothetical protein
MRSSPCHLEYDADRQRQLALLQAAVLQVQAEGRPIYAIDPDARLRCQCSMVPKRLLLVKQLLARLRL